jgi:hypothetical protein
VAQQKQHQEVTRQVESQRPRYATSTATGREQGLSLEHSIDM